jgi:hypothetical protein
MTDVGVPMAKSSEVVQIGGFGSTLRRDAWWAEIVPSVVLLSAFGIYATFRAFEGKFYAWGPYLSPFYSPLIDSEHHWWRFSPALLVLAGPLGFRATCYYYRKAYYRAFFLDPPACAVSEVGKRRYRGETSFPFVLQNLHRWFLYVALVFLAFLWRDAIRGFFFKDGFGVGVGSLILIANIVLLTLYTLSCHSLRHLVGGKLDCFSCASFGPARHTTWRWFSGLNERHMLFAWMSLISVGVADFYVRMVSSGLMKDIRLL